MSTLESAEQWEARGRELDEMIRRNERHDEIHRGFMRGLLGAIVMTTATTAYICINTWFGLHLPSAPDVAKTSSTQTKVIQRPRVGGGQVEVGNR